MIGHNFPREPLRRSRLAVLLALAIALAPGAFTYGQNEDGDVASGPVERGMLPAAPAKLFDALPGKLKTWKMIRSTAEQRYGDWLESHAVREFERIIPPEEAPAPDAPDPGPPPVTRITVIDTAGHAPALMPYANFTEAKEESFERKFINGNPAYIIHYEADAEIEVRMLVDRRFIVKVLLQRQPEDFLEHWMERLNLRALSSLPDTGEVELPETIVIAKIDQLEPERNTAYQLATSSDQRLDRQLEEDENWLRMMLGEIPDLSDDAADVEAGGPVE